MFVKPEPGLLAVSSACAVVCTADCQLYKRGWMFECYERGCGQMDVHRTRVDV